MREAEPVLVGIDAGTSRIRALAFAPDGRLLAGAAGPTPYRRPAPELAELDAEELFATTVATLGALARRLEEPRRVIGLAVASVGEAGVLLDAEDRPLAPILAWFDPRPAALRADLLDRVSPERFARIAGVTADPILGALKLAWYARSAPEAFARARKWLHLADWLAFRLGGAPATDASLASRTGLLDLRAGRWSEELAARADVPIDLLPEILPTGTRIGALSPEIAASTGLPASAAIAVGGYDHALGLLAVGGDEPGVVVDSMGTAEGLALPLPEPVLDGRLAASGFSQVLIRVDRPRACVLTGLATSGAAIDWACALFARGTSRKTLVAAARAVPPECGGVFFVPHLRFPSPPATEAEARGMFFGLSPDSDAATLFRAVLEGLALDWQRMLVRLCDLLERPLPERMLAIGGGTRIGLLLEIKASLAGRPLAAAAMPEATALGAALAAGIGAGLFSDLVRARAGLRLSFRTIRPDPAWPPERARRHLARYGELVCALAPLQRRAAAWRAEA
ncbi:MAG: FGGY family carbohydrate kinase [Geminicoccaceae bacterium]|nr:FGGY family carbohydrate kinase [Geminicoccaceae bacterium]MCS7267511.1 FGGY family carbohydrate kinase [Geminicoccaceae bacterium]MCX7630668.1 FGGY family carbohydrate kinase [Geminicoccaceae bacterium]MDW8123715.1 FGGY family carbohydrate kinase [Geminicoccaceae bacterium]